MNEALQFGHPEPPRERPRIHPVFLPFAGCPHRCLFCDQASQTGQGVRSLGDIHKDLETELFRLVQAYAPPREIAFYGGTFTALPAPWPKRFLDLASQYKTKGLITRVRCSTRPDAITTQGLEQLRSLGLDMVELGIQSFDDDALAASGRGYTGRIAREGCTMVKKAGLSLGVQLLPGLPGDRQGVFARDCEITASIQSEAARLYPCLVLDGTKLAETWKGGGYQPWTLEHTRSQLSSGLSKLWEAGVPVIRMGLAPEPGLAPRILAGPHHPSLGQMVRSLALFDHIKGKAATMEHPPTQLRYPGRYSGEAMGHGGELAERYKGLGLTDVSGWNSSIFSLC